MSDHSTASVHDEDHTGPIKNPKQLLLAVAYSFILPVFIIIGLVYFVTSGNKPAAGSVDPERATAERIQKVGLVQIRDANRALRTGEEVYKLVCSGCHLTGAAGSPKFGDAAAWSPRIKTGFNALWNSALKGKNGMPAQGGGDVADLEVARAVVYIANAGGAKFEEPKEPAAAPAK
jgi:cytochrome c5